MIGVVAFHLLALVVGLVVMLVFGLVFALSKSERIAYGFMFVTSYLIGLSIVSHLV